jgi:cytidine deaminase
MSTESTQLGVLTSVESLSDVERQLIQGAWAACEHAYVPRSKFPVGSSILAQNPQGDVNVFHGCNVENRFFGPTICGERNAVTTMIAEGYTKVLKLVLVCKNYQGPGASPCGACRQVLVEFGGDADLFNLADKPGFVWKATVADLLPAAKGMMLPYATITAAEKRLVKRVHALLPLSYVPYSKKQHAAIFVAHNKAGRRRHFPGVTQDNASYGVADAAENVAMCTARTNGYDRNVTLAVAVDDPRAVNPVEGRCLQALREYGLEAKVLLIGADRSVVRTTIEELLPDSFGPQSLA